MVRRRTVDASVQNQTVHDAAAVEAGIGPEECAAGLAGSKSIAAGKKVEIGPEAVPVGHADKVPYCNGFGTAK